MCFIGGAAGALTMWLLEAYVRFIEVAIDWAHWKWEARRGVVDEHTE